MRCRPAAHGLKRPSFSLRVPDGLPVHRGGASREMPAAPTLHVRAPAGIVSRRASTEGKTPWVAAALFSFVCDCVVPSQCTCVFSSYAFPVRNSGPPSLARPLLPSLSCGGSPFFLFRDFSFFFFAAHAPAAALMRMCGSLFSCINPTPRVIVWAGGAVALWWVTPPLPPSALPLP